MLKISMQKDFIVLLNSCRVLECRCQTTLAQLNSLKVYVLYVCIAEHEGYEFLQVKMMEVKNVSKEIKGKN